jgi:hypothetical protein
MKSDDALALERRRFLGYFSSLGLGATLLPGALLAQAAEAEAITPAMVGQAARVAELFRMTDGYGETIIAHDPGGIERVVGAARKGGES